MDGFDHHEDEVQEELVDQIADVRERLKRLEDDPDDLLAIGLVIAYTDETTEMCQAEGHDHTTGGVVLRMLNPKAHEGYRNIGSLMADIDTFDEQCEEIKLRESGEPEAEVMGIGLDDLLGGGGPL